MTGIVPVLPLSTFEQTMNCQGYFSLFDWLLTENLLAYDDYEAWRNWHIDSLDGLFVLEQAIGRSGNPSLQQLWRNGSGGRCEKSRWHKEDEPDLDAEEWIEFGGESIWAAGFTAGGAPYGLTLAEYRECAIEAAPHHGWARTLRILRHVFGYWADGTDGLDIGRVRYLGEGIDRKAWFAEVSLYPDPHGLSECYVVLLPKPDVGTDFPERARREASLLHRLSRTNIPFQIPRIASVFPEEGLPVVPCLAGRKNPYRTTAGGAEQTTRHTETRQRLSNKVGTPPPNRRPGCGPSMPRLSTPDGGRMKTTDQGHHAATRHPDQ